MVFRRGLTQMPDQYLIASDGGNRYLIAATAHPGPLDLVRVVDLATGLVSPEIALGSVLAQEEPDYWLFEEGQEPRP